MFGGTVKKSHLEDLQVLQTIIVGAVRGEGWCRQDSCDCID